MKIIDSKNGKFKEQENERKEIICSCLSAHTYTQNIVLAGSEIKGSEEGEPKIIENGKTRARDKCSSLNVPSNVMKNLAL